MCDPLPTLGGVSDPGPRPCTAAELISTLPDHLGWDSAPYAELVRAQLAALQVEGSDEVAPPRDDATAPPEPAIAIFGHLLDRLQREGLEGVGRVWLLLRFLDRQRGEGRVSLALARHMLTSKHSTYKCLSWKRLRQLLNEGEGVFWHRDEERNHIYYHAEARVAQTLGLTTIRGWAVKIPVRELCGSITAVRAIFYDAFHSSRGDGFNKPITRYILNERGNGDSRTQRKYEQIRGIQRQASFATLGQYDKLTWRQAQAADKEAEVRFGGPAFIYVDYKGILGENPHRLRRVSHQQHWHNIYIMRQIGNAYQGTLPTVKRGRRWTNLKLKHLCNSMLPTGSFAVEDFPTPDAKLYHDTAEAALAVIGDRRRERPSYWPRSGAQGQSGYWQEAALPWVETGGSDEECKGGKKIC